MNLPECFVIMPITDPDTHQRGHFQKVYEFIFKPAIIKAGFSPRRADDVRETNFIHLDILQSLVKSPMAICDLSTQNPNVMYELGLRQAFDMPVVLVQERGNKQIFDIGPLRYTEYDSKLEYQEVLDAQSSIYESICATKKANENHRGMNSLVNLLSIAKPASLKNINEDDITQMLQLLVSEVGNLRSDVQKLKHVDSNPKNNQSDLQLRMLIASSDEYSQDLTNEIENDLIEIKSDLANNIPFHVNKGKYNRVKSKIYALRNGASSKETREMAEYLLQQMNELFVDIIHDQGP